ncbi:MAG: DUF1592 domain-containing protein [Reinekea sp.]|nr:DUF1592 domain-containing protein [Reinekea sp.]
MTEFNQQTQTKWIPNWVNWRLLLVIPIAVLLQSCTQSFDDTNAFAIAQDDSAVVINVEFWARQCESCHATDKVADDGSLRYWGSRSEKTLADYITTTMPYANPGACVDECAVETARYLQATLKGNTIINSDGGATSTVPEDTDDAGLNIEMPDSFAAKCASCHTAADIARDFISWRLSNTETLANYIESTMPFGNVTQCTGTCALENAEYIHALLDAASDNSSNGQTEPEVTSPSAPANLTIEYSENSIVLTWDDTSLNETSFLIWRKVGNGSWSIYQTLNMDSVRFQDNAVPDAKVYYRVAAKNNHGSSELSATVEWDLSPDNNCADCLAPAFVAGTQYMSGQIVANAGSYYQCKPGVAAWCSSTAAWAYEPGVGLYWMDAWTEVETSGMTEPEIVLTSPTLSSANVSDTRVTLTWLDNATGETAYVIEKALDDGAWFVLANLPANSEGYTDSANTGGTSVKYRIYAQTETAIGAKTTTQAITIAVAEIFNASTYYASDCAACHGARGEGTNSGLQIASFASSSLSKNDMALAIENTMPYGNASDCSGVCATLLAEFIFTEFMTASSTPAAASNIFVGANTSKTLLNISWTDNADNETGYKIEKSVNGGGFNFLTNAAENTTTLTDSQIVIGSTYQYRITAFNATDVSTTVLSAVFLLEADETAPFKPTNLSAVLSGQAVRLTWIDNATNETQYVLQRRQNKGTWQSDILLAANSNQFIDNNAAFGNVFDYRVLATNNVGDSPWSEEVSIDLTDVENRVAFESHCLACHRDGGVGVNLTTEFTKQSWADNDWNDFTAKVNTMNTANCDAQCKQNAATYVWAETWGYETELVVAEEGRGVRGLRLLTSYEYANAVYDIFGVTIAQERLPADRHGSEFKYASEANAGVVVYDRQNEYLLLAEYIAANASNFGCDTECSTAQMQILLEKTFRTAVTTQALNDFMAFQSNYGREDTVAAMLLSPLFLYRSELGEWNANKEAYQLTDYEVATALAFQIWGTTPDAELLSKAGNGQLSTQAQIDAQATQMMQDPRAVNHFIEFVRYYTNTTANLSEKPNLTHSVIQAMNQERNEAVRYALTQGEATLDELFNPGYTFINDDLAQQYGLSTPGGSSMTKVATLPSRGGLLHQGILQVHNSDFTATSLVKRGKLIRENMMCHMMGVPSGVDPSAIDLPQEPITTRERWDVITGPDASEGQCWACHQLMNEPGSVLEAYDAAGRLREAEAAYNDATVTLTLDTSGVLRSNDATIELLAYEDTRDLSEYLANSDVGMDCFVDNYYRFTTGREVDGDVQANVDQIAANFRTDGKIWNMIADTVHSDAFLFRTDRD